jgi:sulfate adenylyltransferase subunit 2
MTGTASTHLDALEAEAIYILRETASWFRRPALLFSGGKDSLCMVALALRAFRPRRLPFPLMHIDTGHNFPETLEFRDRLLAQIGEELLVRRVQDTIDAGRARDEVGPKPSRNLQQTVTLLDSVRELGLDALIGGGRRDEEKARAKERIFSLRNDVGGWDPHKQRPEFWLQLNGALRPGEHMRVFPLSNWTELDVWQYIAREKLDIPALYRAHRRRCLRTRTGILLAESPFLALEEGESIEDLSVRFRTVGDMTCSAAMESRAVSIEEIIREIAAARTSERGLRMDDRRSESAMEERKSEGYF